MKANESAWPVIVAIQAIPIVLPQQTAAFIREHRLQRLSIRHKSGCGHRYNWRAAKMHDHLNARLRPDNLPDSVSK
jgi:hypothetical protein